MGKINFIKGQKNNYKPDNSLNEVYGDGGEVAQKIKDKLAKGSFELPMEMIVYVPSTKDGNVIIPKGDFQARVKNVRAFLATKFGGFSSNPTDGGYMSNDNKGLIEEDVVKVTAFATKEALEENLSPLLKKIQYWCKAWSQESIGFEFEGDLFYISATSKFMAGGVARDGDQDNRTMIMRQAKEVSHHVEELNEILSKQPDIDAWVVAKMQDVTTQLSEITHYLDSRVGFRLGGDDIQAVQDSMLKDGGGLKQAVNYARQQRYFAEKREDKIKWFDKLPRLERQELFYQLKGRKISIDQFLKEGDKVSIWNKVHNGSYTKYANGGEIILGGGSMASVQDSILANGARLDNAQASIKDIERQLEKYQRLAADYMHSTRNPTYSPYDKDVDRLEKELQQKLKESDIYNFDTEDDFSERTLGKKSISKEIQMAQSWLPRIASPYRPRSYSYSKFVRSLITPMQKDVFEKLQKEYWQKAWNTKIKISPKKDTIEFEHYNKKKGNWYMEDGGEIAANGAKLKSGKLTLSKLKSMIEEYNAEGRNFELLGAYNQLELWGNDHRLETGSKEDIYRALIRYRYNPKYADGTELSNIDSMTDEEIITFANTFSYYDRMDEGIEEEFTDVEDAKEYLRMMAESE
jgi:hypothetical protein